MHIIVYETNRFELRKVVIDDDDDDVGVLMS